MQIKYQIDGVIDVPDGTEVCDDGGIRLPDGRKLRVWESWEMESDEGDEYVDVSYEDMINMDLFYDGQTADYEVVV